MGVLDFFAPKPVGFRPIAGRGGQPHIQLFPDDPTEAREAMAALKTLGKNLRITAKGHDFGRVTIDFTLVASDLGANAYVLRMSAAGTFLRGAHSDEALQAILSAMHASRRFSAAAD